VSDNNFKVYVQKDHTTDSLVIMIKQKFNNKWWYAQPMELVFKQKEEMAYVDPTLRVHGDYADDFIEAFRFALDGKTLDHFKGELDATKKHLEDMRHLVYKDKYTKLEDK